MRTYVQKYRKLFIVSQAGEIKRMTSPTTNNTVFSRSAPETTFVIITFYMSFVCILSVILNFAAAYVLLVKDRCSSALSVLIFSLTCSNLFFTITTTPLTIYANYKRKWTMGSSACSYYGLMTFSGGLSSIYHLLLLSIERFISVVHPFEKDTFLQSFYVYLSAIISWILPFASSSLPLLGWSKYTIESIGTACSVDIFPDSFVGVSYNIFIFLTGYTLPMSIIIYLNVRFLKEVQVIINRAKDKLINVREQSKEILKNERCLMRQMCLQVIAFVACFNIAWLPYAVVFALGMLRAKPFDNPLIESIPSFFAKSYSLYDPILFFVLNKRFRSLLMSCIYGDSDADANELEMNHNDINRQAVKAGDMEDWEKNSERRQFRRNINSITNG